MTAPTDFIDVPSGALCGEVITLTCKGPDEERSYILEYDSQLDPDDYITSASIVASDVTVSVTNIVILGRRFRFTVTGGVLNQVSGISFTINLKSGDIRTLICVLPIEAQGVLQSGTVPVIMGTQGARGTQIWFSMTDPTPSYVPPNGVAINAGDIVFSRGTNSFFTASFANGSLTWTLTAGFVTTVDANSAVITPNNTTTLGTVADNAISAADVTSFFQVVNGRLCIIRSKLQTTPTQDGELYDPGQGIMYIHYGTN